MYDQPLVSVVAVCYNHAKYLVETLDSIIAQTYSNIELIIMDDCSTDNSVEVINHWIVNNEVDCKFVSHPKNQGLCKTLNEALGYTKGKYLNLIACDDILFPTKIALNVKVIEEKGNEYAVVHSDAWSIDKDSVVLNKSYLKNSKLSQEEPNNYFEALLTGCQIITPTAFVRLSSILEVGGYDESLFFEDWDMWLRLSEKFKFVRIEEPLVKIRVLASSMSRAAENKVKMHNSSIDFLNKVQKRYPNYLQKIERTIILQIDQLIALNKVTFKQVYRKFKFEKSAYALYLMLMMTLGIKPAKANFFKKQITRR
jgi:glycosyltransferase involved in cell wall biosynthesis